MAGRATEVAAGRLVEQTAMVSDAAEPAAVFRIGYRGAL